MRIGVLGINHKSADLAYREILAKACYKQFAKRSRSVLLTTCHRTEIYFSAEDLAAAHSALLHALREEIPVAFEHKLYAYFSIDCFEHLARVTAGLDSLILAESEIQRQVKNAYELACLHSSLPSPLHYLFQKSLRLGKHLRSHFSLFHGQLTIPKTIYEISRHFSTQVEQMRVLFIGNSEINRQVLAHFKQKGLTQMDLCTRSPLSSQETAIEYGITLFDWSHLAKWSEYDMVIAGTNTSSFLIHLPEGAAQTRAIFDLGVPRNVDPRIARHPHIALFNIDELGALMQKKQINHFHALKKAEDWIEKKAAYYYSAFNEKRTRQCV